MSRIKQQYTSNHHFGIGILNSTDETNIGGLWRSAYILGASFIFTVNKQYQPQSSDVVKAWTKIPLYHYKDIDDLKSHLPFSTRLIGVEMTDDASPLHEYQHPSRAVYLLGSEGRGLTKTALRSCHEVIFLPGHFSLNVATTRGIVLYDRITKMKTVLPN